MLITVFESRCSSNQDLYLLVGHLVLRGKINYFLITCEDIWTYKKESKRKGKNAKKYLK